LAKNRHITHNRILSEIACFQQLTSFRIARHSIT
jgi:hypothetical protein